MWYLVYVVLVGQVGSPVVMPEAYKTEKACQDDALANNARINGSSNKLGNASALGFTCVVQNVK